MYIRGMDNLIAQISAEVKHERKKLGLTQQQAADLAGVSIGFLQSLEGGKTTLHLEKVIRVVETLGLELVLMPRDANTHTIVASQPES